MLILGIETSCDETAASVVRDGKDVLANTVYSQIKLHEKFGGVVPEVACRRHVEIITYVIDEALERAGITFCHIDRIAVTNRPGLIGALLIGLSAAKAVAYAKGMPLVGINHIEAHAFSAALSHSRLTCPYICLVVSGGHTSLYLVHSFRDFELLGRTLDDAAGEAYDKVSKILGLGYPGGPAIDRLVSDYRGEAVYFPRTLLNENSLDFSFSGLKTAVLYKVRPPKGSRLEKEKIDLNSLSVSSIAAGFQESLVEVLVKKAMLACKIHNISKIALGGGVSANSYLQNSMIREANKHGFEVFYPAGEYCTDNAAMIAGLGFYRDAESGKEILELKAEANI